LLSESATMRTKSITSASLSRYSANPERIQGPDRRSNAGVSLMEMLVVVMLISLMIAIAVPSFQSGLPAIRLRSASSSVAQFLVAARNQVDREQRAVLLRIHMQRGILSFQAVSAPGRPPLAPEILQLPDGITIANLQPAPLALVTPIREYVLYPGGTVPPFTLHLTNDRGGSRWITLDPITYVAQVTPEQPQSGLWAGPSAEVRP